MGLYTITLSDPAGQTYELPAETASEARELALCEVGVSLEEATDAGARGFFSDARRALEGADELSIECGLFAFLGEGLRVEVSSELALEGPARALVASLSERLEAAEEQVQELGDAHAGALAARRHAQEVDGQRQALEQETSALRAALEQERAERAKAEAGFAALREDVGALYQPKQAAAQAKKEIARLEESRRGLRQRGRDLSRELKRANSKVEELSAQVQTLGRSLKGAEGRRKAAERKAAAQVERIRAERRFGRPSMAQAFENAGVRVA